MNHHRRSLSCEEFSARMPELIAAGEDIFAHPHVRQCKLHRALLEDLEEIARAAKQMFPEVDPPDTLWNGIESRIAQNFLASIISDPWPGCRVIVNAQLIEGYYPHASPPLPGKDKPSPIRLNVLDAGRTSARRERRQ